MCRLAYAFRRPLHELATWPAADLAVLKAYADVRPPVEERVEEMFAVFQAIYVNSKKAEGATPSQPSVFLLHRGEWPAPERDYGAENRKAIAAFRNVSSRIRQK